ncbi:superoxide dismutase family protein [Burkholderia glumae]|uniref:superoxide dismutase family protein n=1 Tax=Burkholderia glumae TaxID=337 RepID=UPI0003A6E88B|nr:superoxide dismutase family protein [Burkholderia glumae]MCR1766705.1 superoxide dismutase family protein [Burkholderia glumae]QHP90651.1 superoxide dismutase family protein [Burkholderia glumae]QJP72497.1 superoxide dismutase family protein [Burkholderia glumae]QKM48093.1 Superoxide dismutase (Cu-Zn) [Burkholderia glumae]
MKQRFERTACLSAGAVLAVMVLLNGCTSFASTHEKRADALLQPTFGSQARGTLTFVERPDGVQVTYNIAGLPPNTDHALQVHDRGDCNAVDGASAGPVFAPSADRLRAGARVAGDLGNIHADSNGVAAGFIVAPDVALDGVRSVLGRSVLIHRDAGDPAFPQHSAGPGLACGVVR